MCFFMTHADNSVVQDEHLRARDREQLHRQRLSGQPPRTEGVHAGAGLRNLPESGHR